MSFRSAWMAKAVSLPPRYPSDVESLDVVEGDFLG